MVESPSGKEKEKGSKAEARARADRARAKENGHGRDHSLPLTGLAPGCRATTQTMPTAARKQLDNFDMHNKDSTSATRFLQLLVRRSRRSTSTWPKMMARRPPTSRTCCAWREQPLRQPRTRTPRPIKRMARRLVLARQRNFLRSGCRSSSGRLSTARKSGPQGTPRTMGTLMATRSSTPYRAGGDGA